MYRQNLSIRYIRILEPVTNTTMSTSLIVTRCGCKKTLPVVVKKEFFLHAYLKGTKNMYHCGIRILLRKYFGIFEVTTQ